MLKSNGRKSLVAIVFFFIATSLFAQKDLVISGGNTVSSFVCENKTAFVWGSNSAGQLGLHDAGGALITTDPIVTPTAITKFNGITTPPDIKQINSGSGSHFVALACLGDVWAWGVNGSGQIGTGSSGGIVTIPTRVIANTAVAAANRGAGNVLQNAAVVYSGTVNSFAILNDGKLVSWGGNSAAQAGQLGNGNTTDQTTANYVLTAAGTPLTGVKQIFAGDNVAYALVDPDGDGLGTIYSWGNGLNGTLGRDATGTGNPSTTTTPDFSTVQDSYARPVYYVDDTQMNNITQIQAGDVFGIALDATGYVWTWGNGAWNNATGNTTVNYQGSDPRRVIAGNTTGGSTDGNGYLLAKAIGGGQGYGMAVTADGKPVAWGGTGACANGGMTGTGPTNGTAALPPTYIQRTGGIIDNNVTLINRGDTWGFYGTSDNKFYAWGCNNFGQLGIGNTTNQAYASLITPPTGCSFRDPLPTARLNHPDTTVCASTFTSLALTAGFTPPTVNADQYVITWEKATTLTSTTYGAPLKTGTADIAANLNYTASTTGKYRVTIHYKGANSGCIIFDDAKDSIVIAPYIQNFTVPTTLTYCGNTINPYVTGLGNYSWFKDATGGSALTTTQKSNPATILTSAVNPAVANVITVYVQETGQYVGNIAKVTPTNCTSITNKDNYNPVNSVFTLSNAKSLTFDTITVYVANNNATYTNIQLAIYNTKLDGGGTHKIANTASVLFTTAAVSVTTVGTTGYTALKIPVNYTLNGAIGGTYAIGFVKNSINGLNVANFDCNKVGTKDDIATGGPYLTSTGSESNGNWTSGFGSLGNILFHTPIGFCDRVPVKLTQACPCSKPTVVTITAPATTPVAICQGAAQTLSGTTTVPAASLNGGFTYSWYKSTGTPTPTAITIPPSTPTAVPSNTTLITGLTTDAGTYILRVEDGNTGNSACYTEATIVLTVNPKPTITSSATGTVCSGVAQNYAITSSVPSSYAWTRAAVTNITPATAGSGTTSAITETLTNTTTAAIVVRYVITPTSTTGSCVGTAFNYDVTVNPSPVITSATTGTVCTGVAQNYAITSNIPSSYAWTRAIVSNITPATAGSGTTSPITETLTNTTAAAIVVRYVLTPTSTTGTCVGASSNYDVTVNPAPKITSAAIGSICSGVAQAYTITSNIASSYAWTRAAVTNITPATAGSGATASIAETLTNSTAAAIVVRYVITPTATTGSCVGTAFNYDVTVNPTPAITSSATGAVCTGIAQNYAITSNVASSYAWTRAAVTNITPATAGSGTTSPITETLTNTTAAGIVVRYVITPTSTTGTCVGTPFNYDVTVNPQPVITSASTGIVCSGVAQNYAITSNVVATYAWTRAAVTNITPATAGSGTTSPITETLTNTTTAAIVVRYVITPTAGCAGTPFNYDVTVNPAPVITSAATGSICTGVAQAYTVTSNIPSSYVWTRAAVTNITPTTGSGTTASIAETLTNTTAAAIVVRYVITPTATTGTCAGTAFNYDVTVNPKPTITSSATGSVCSGVAQNYAITSNVASSYTWSRAAVTNIAPATAGSGTTTPITETLTNTTAAAIVVRYVITPTATTGGCVGTAFNYDVTVNPKPTITSATSGTTCTGVALNYLITSDVASNYSWTRASVSGVTPTTGSGTTNPITETLTLPTGSANVVYVITPTSTSGSCVGTAFNYTVTVSGTAVPTVTLTQTPAGTICAGTSVTFKATPTSGGNAVYAWSSSINGTLVPTIDTYTSSGLQNNEVITVVLTSDLGCANPKTATASTTMTVTTKVTPTITVTADKTSICPSETATFTAAITNGGTSPGPTYKWYNGATLLSGETNSTYAATGTVLTSGNSITAELTTGLTCVTAPTATSTPVSVTVTPVPAPTVTITSDKTSICSGNPVVFTAVPGGTGTTTPAPGYQWYIGSTLQSGETNATFTTSNLSDATPPITPTHPGNDVHVTIVSNAACANTTAVSSNTIIITVNPGVLPGSISTGSSFCSGTTPGAITELTAATGITASATYTWEQNTTNPINPANWVTAVGTPTNSGKGFTPGGTVSTDISYRRTVTDNTLPSACQAATTNAITYTVIALPSISSASSGTICSGIAQNYTITSAIASSYVWSRNSVSGITPATGISGQISNPITETLVNTTSSAIPVSYSIVPTSTTGSCVGATFTYTVTVNPLPKVAATPTEPNLICSGVSHTYTISSDIAATYSWTRAGVNNITPATGSGATSSITETLSNQTIGTASPADIIVNYVITPTSSPGGCVGPQVTYPLTVAVAAVPTVTVTANKAGICAGVPVKYTATGTATGIGATYQWYQSSAANPGGVAVGTNSTTYTTTDLASSTDKVWVVMTSNFPCIAVGSQNPVASQPVSIEVKQAPKPQIETDQVICSADGSFTYTATNLQSNSTLQWQLNAQNISKATGLTYNATQSGLYTVVEDNGYCTGGSSASKLTIVPTPDAYAGSDMYVTEGTFVQLQAGGGITGTTYSWIPTTGLSSSTISNPSFKADNTITYTVTLTNTDAASGHTCSGESSVTITVVKPIVVPNVITVNGDGNNDTWHIQHIEGYPNATFEIYNRWGNLIWKSTGYPKEWDGTNFRNGEVLPDGTYFYIINLHSQIFTEPYTGWIQIVK